MKKWEEYFRELLERVDGKMICGGRERERETERERGREIGKGEGCGKGGN